MADDPDGPIVVFASKQDVAKRVLESAINDTPLDFIETALHILGVPTATTADAKEGTWVDFIRKHVLEHHTGGGLDEPLYIDIELLVESLKEFSDSGWDLAVIKEKWREEREWEEE